MSERPGPLSLQDAVDRVVASGSFLLGVDFDGTLAPIVDRPDMAVPSPDAVEALRRLAASQGVDVAVVSGRSLDDLKDRLGDISDATYVGEHGNDMGEDFQESETLHEARKLMDRLQDEMPDATVEHKRRSVTFHTRNLSRGKAREAREAIREWAQGRDGITLLEGKEVYELTTATGTKGDIIVQLAAGRPVIYIGDDTTDESVFEALGDEDIGIKVGDGVTAAAHRVEDVTEVVRILEGIALASG